MKGKFFGIILLFNLLFLVHCGPDNVNCNEPLVYCNNTCVNVQTDSSHCGECNNECSIEQTCDRGECKSICIPQQEECNGIDDDCDNEKDENLYKECEADFGTGQQKCEDGMWLECKCIEGQEYECGTEEMLNRIGICRPGKAVCVDGQLGNCNGGIVPQNHENCSNDDDDDCNGSPNDGCACNNGQKRDCCQGDVCGSNGCNYGSQTCVCDEDGQNCQWGQCTGGTMPIQEICDGQDNDCDGTPDNDIPIDSWENNNDCDHFRDLPGAVETDSENPVETLINGTLYPQGDIDWLWFELNEGSHIVSCLMDEWTPRQCYFNSLIKLKIPQEKDYRVCLLATQGTDPICNDFPVNMDNCQEDINCYCTNPAEDCSDGVCQLLFKWEGSCIFDDTWNFLVKIFGNSSDDYSCQQYSLSYYLYYTDEQCPEEE